LTDDFGLGHADRVDALTDDFDRDGQRVGVVVAHGLEGDRGATLEVEAERGTVARDEVRRHRGNRHEDDANEREEKPTTHGV
jgi:hypothetical protein